MVRTTLVGMLAALLLGHLGGCSSETTGPGPSDGDIPPEMHDAAADLPLDDGPSADLDAIEDTAPDVPLPDAPVDEPEPDLPPYALTVQIDGEGTVELDPGGQECTAARSPCSVDFVAGTEVTLTATPGEDHAFDHWSGDCSGTDATTTVTMDAAKTCGASFLGQTGEIELVPAPTSVVPNTTEDDVNIMLFVEQADLELTQPLAFDSHISGTMTSPLADAGGELPTGVRVNVYFLHFDPVGSGTTGVTRVATLTLPQPVLALSYVETTLDATDDQVGHPDVIYPAAGEHPDRDLELTGQDEFTLGDDRRTLGIDFFTSTSSDQIRIISAASGQLSLVHSDRLVHASAPPSDVAAGATEDSEAVLLFEESSSTLAADVMVDVDAPGVYTSGAALTGGTVSSGTAARSYLIHFDPVGAAYTTVTASVTFETEVLGIVLGGSNLDDSDGLGASGTSYPTGSEPNRATEIGGGDSLRFTGDRRSLRFTLAAQNGTDQIRVLVAGP